MTDQITTAPDLDPEAGNKDTLTVRKAPPRPPLNEDQRAALSHAKDWIENGSDPYFVLRGYAGTGKTFTIQELLKDYKGRIVFTAPTNKATKVLRESVTTPEYKPECRTIYSLLGLRIQPNGEVKELREPEDPIDLSQFKLIVVDEGSMISTVVMQHIDRAQAAYKLKFLFMGDPAQLPPVKEDESRIWKLKCPGHTLTKVMRHDNQILKLVTHIRDNVDRPMVQLKLADDFDSNGGVRKLAKPVFRQMIIGHASEGTFTKGLAKAIAWRNVTVDDYNSLIRKAIYGQDSAQRWLPGDRVIFTEPAKDWEDEVIAFTDDEGLVEKVIEDWHPIHGQIKCHRVTIQMDDGGLVVAWVVHPQAQADLSRELESLAQRAKSNPRLWAEYWMYKEAFHSLRHAYSITAHRSQGSTYESAFVDFQDILLNRNRPEALRCLYVACSRPKRFLGLA